MPAHPHLVVGLQVAPGHAARQPGSCDTAGASARIGAAGGAPPSGDVYAAGCARRAPTSAHPARGCSYSWSRRIRRSRAIAAASTAAEQAALTRVGRLRGRLASRRLASAFASAHRHRSAAVDASLCSRWRELAGPQKQATSARAHVCACGRGGAASEARHTDDDDDDVEQRASCSSRAADAGPRGPVAAGGR